jgi:hypothetical protein
VGYFGTVLLVRASGPITRLPGLDSLGVRHVRLRDLGGGWQLLETSRLDDPPDLTAAVGRAAQAWRAPVLAAYVDDGDCAEVRAAVPGGPGWAAHLPTSGLPSCEQHREVHDLRTGEDLLAVVDAWAATAGLRPSTAGLARVLGADQPGGSAEELAVEAVRALGFADIPAPRPYAFDPDAPPFRVITDPRIGLASRAFTLHNVRRRVPSSVAPWEARARALEKEVFAALWDDDRTADELAATTIAAIRRITASRRRGWWRGFRHPVVLAQYVMDSVCLWIMRNDIRYDPADHAEPGDGTGGHDWAAGTGRGPDRT